MHSCCLQNPDGQLHLRELHMQDIVFFICESGLYWIKLCLYRPGKITCLGFTASFNSFP